MSLRTCRGIVLALLAIGWLPACGRIGYGDALIDAGTGLLDAQSADLASDASDASEDMPVEDLGADASDATFDMGEPPAPAIVVLPVDGLTTTEMGGTANFTVVLASAPSSNVSIALSSSDPGEGSISPSSLTFTTLNWNAPQSVVVAGVDDLEADGPQMFVVVTSAATSTDPAYSGLDADDVSVTNIDDETPGVLLLPSTGLVTSELGDTDTFSIRLLAQPADDVTIPLVSSNTAEATVSPASVTFTSTNWASAQTVTVTGVDDSVEDGDQTYSVQTQPAVSMDPAYDTFDGEDIDGVNRDDELAVVFVTPLSGISTSESGGTATFTVVLQSPPVADVMLAIESSDLTEGTASVASIVFTSTDWNVPQSITVTGVDDAIADGNQLYEIAVGPTMSTDPLYSSLPVQQVAVSNSDDDSAAYEVLDPSAFVTTEAGLAQTFSVVLRSQPLSSVSLSFTSSDTSEGTVAPALRTFTTSNWNVPQTVTVTGVDDTVADGDQAYNVVVHIALTADPAYLALADSFLAFTNVDDESAGIIVTPTTGLTTSESGGTATFTMVLSSTPSASVTINLSSSLPTEGTVSPASVTFTTFNWNTPRTVTVTGVDDLAADGSRVYQIITAPATSADLQYNGLDASDVSVVNADNDSPGVYVSPIAINAPEGSTGTFTVVLGSQPTANVVVPVHMANVAQGTISPASVTFNTVNWNSPQTVTVTGVDDGLLDGTYINTAITDPAMSTDLIYSGVDGADVTVTTVDRPTITVSPTSGLVTAESATVASFTIVLDVAPSSNVTISLSTSDASEGTPLQSSVTFTPSNWSTPQQVDVRGVDDTVADETQAYTIVTAPALSADSRYNGLNAANVDCTNTDNDVASVDMFLIGPSTTSENRTTTTVYYVMGAATTGNVQFRTSDATEATVSPTGVSGTFYAGYTHVLLVTGVDDLLADGDMPYTVYATITSPDSGYNGYVVPIVDMTNLDNESGSIWVTPTAQVVVSEGGATATFHMRLASAPTADVSIALSSSDSGEATVSPSSVTFTTANWSTPRVVTVTGVADGILDGDELVSIVTSPATSADGAYNGVNPSDVEVTNVDVQSARLISGTPLYFPDVGAINALTGHATSADNRYVAFESSSASLVPGDTNASSDIFVRDRVMGTTQRVSVSTSGTEGSGQASDPAISADGRYVAFRSHATTLVAGDTNNSGDIFVRDMVLNTTTRVSLATGGVELNNTSFTPSLSSDGRYVSFLSTATNAVAGDTNSAWDMFVHDRMTGTTVRASLNSAGLGYAGGSGFGTMSSNGRYVVFPTSAALAGSDTNGLADVYVRDLLMNTTTLVSQSTGGVVGNGSSNTGVISADGRYIAFESAAFNLTAGDTNNVSDIFVRDTVMNTTVRASVGALGVQGNGRSNLASISDDGQRVAFISDASNLVADDTNFATDVFVRDIGMGVTYLVSRSPTGAPQNTGSSVRSNISPDGTLVVIATPANNILPEVFDSASMQQSVYAVPVL